MTELVFQMDEDSEGGFTAQAVDASIFTEAEALQDLRAAIRNAVSCPFDDRAARPVALVSHRPRQGRSALSPPPYPVSSSSIPYFFIFL